MTDGRPPERRSNLTPGLCQDIVVRNTPDAPADSVDPDTKLHDLGVLGDTAAAVHKAGIQSDLNDIGWNINQDRIDSSPASTVADCRDSVLSHAF
jgi:hypothetical protein